MRWLTPRSPAGPAGAGVAGGWRIGGDGARGLRGESCRRRRFWLSLLDSTCGEVEGVGAEHLGATMELGEDSHGGGHGGLGFGRSCEEEKQRERAR
jgi:hypothetical protein